MSTSPQVKWWLLQFFIRLFWLLDNLFCWVDWNLEMRSWMFIVWGNCIMKILWRLHVVWQTWILSRDCDETCQVTLLIFVSTGVEMTWAWNVIFLMKIMWSWKAIIPQGWNLPGGHIITGVGILGQWKEGYDRWMW